MHMLLLSTEQVPSYVGSGVSAMDGSDVLASPTSGYCSCSVLPLEESWTFTLIFLPISYILCNVGYVVFVSNLS